MTDIQDKLDHKYHIVRVSKPVLCGCGAKAMVGAVDGQDMCWKCYRKYRKGNMYG